MMQRIKLLLASFLGLGILAFAAAPAVGAYQLVPACDNNTNTTSSAVCQDNKPNQNPLIGANGIVTKVANIIALIVGVASVIVIIIAGIQYMTSTGDPAKVNTAKNAILYAVVGLVVTLLARTIVVFVISKVAK